MVYPRITT